jgi:hypothetical protein
VDPRTVSERARDQESRIVAGTSAGTQPEGTASTEPPHRADPVGAETPPNRAPRPTYAKTPAALATGARISTANPKVRVS